MSLDRRRFLQGVAAGATAAAVPAPAAAVRPRKTPPADAVGMLYDATCCVGCKSCVVACRRANDLPAETRDGLWDAPIGLSGRTKTVIKLYREGSATSFVKAQCMHCVDPACVSVCMIGALQKRERGIVSYEPARCIGCRYCQIACPFNVPGFEWRTPTPRIVKCELCRHLVEGGGEPACCQACPVGAVIFGTRAELLAEARRRLAEHPGRYHPKIYGENDVGGTQVLYLSAVPFEKLGLPELGDEPIPQLSETIQHGIYKGFIAPLALYALLGLVLVRNHKRRAQRCEQESNTETEGEEREAP